MTHVPQILPFLLGFSLLVGLEHFYIFTRLSHYLTLSGTSKTALGFFLAFLAGSTIAALPLVRRFAGDVAQPIIWMIFCWMGAALVLMVSLVAIDVVWLILKNFTVEPTQNPGRRMFVQHAFGFAALGAAGTLSGYSVWNAQRAVAVKPLTLKLDRLPRALNGLRIAQIADLHIGPMIDGLWLEEVVNKVNALEPDLIAIVGDLVDGSVADLKDQMASIGRLKAPLGVYFVTGNHEYYSGVKSWCSHIAELGIRVLRNERVSIGGPAGESFDLAGVDDWASERFPGEGPDLPKALEGRDPNKTLILLAHQPAAVDEASQHGVDLQLSGHTHGGQIWPFSYLVYVRQPYVSGLHRHRDTQIYVSEGTGYWGPPMRLGTSAEITHITLQSNG